MEDAIDLRPYLEALVRHWAWLVVAAVLGALLAFGISRLIPPAYEATALVVISEPSQRVQFDPRFETVTDDQPVKAYPELAKSDELLRNLLNVLPEGTTSGLTDLRGKLGAESGSDPTLLRFSARSNDAETSAVLANTWASLFVDWANRIYGIRNAQQVAFFEQQLQEAAGALAAAEQALVDFQARSELGILQNELAALLSAQAAYLSNQETTARILQEIGSLRTQVEAQDRAQSLALANQLTALTLQLRAYTVGEDPLPLQLQLAASEDLTGADQSAQLAALDGLTNALQTKLNQTDDALAALNPQILDAQERVEELATQQNRLIRNRTVAEETYISLARKVDEERITSQDTSGGFRLASQAEPPAFAANARPLFNVIIGALIGLLLGVLAVLLVTWLKSWRGEPG